MNKRGCAHKTLCTVLSGFCTFFRMHFRANFLCSLICLWYLTVYIVDQISVFVRNVQTKSEYGFTDKNVHKRFGTYYTDKSMCSDNNLTVYIHLDKL